MSLGKSLAIGAVADEEGLDRAHVDVADLADPFLEFVGIDAGCRNALAIESRRITSRNEVALVDNDVHEYAPHRSIMPTRWTYLYA